MQETPEISKTATALLDAAERLLGVHGSSALSTRRIAEEAGQAHGLIRYYFGSLEALVIRTVERAAERILARQRALYASDQPFLEKWRTAMAHLETDLSADPFPKLAVELVALSWNQPVYRDAVSRLMQGFTDMLSEAVRAALDDYDVAPVDVEALATLIRTFQLGMLAERIAGFDLGHRALLQSIDALLAHLPRRSCIR